MEMAGILGEGGPKRRGSKALSDLPPVFVPTAIGELPQSNPQPPLEFRKENL